ncbi:hypothetical protein [Tellurirhabdus rosea]|uniref:hypothetical protein n=1 Tax=Tellurirhabdus rosea TaxID=2674997 RepID=UPI00225517AB|nr:hypothetical protein [Tellurirhabdus rosea]
MFDLNPLQTPNATLHHWIMLLVAGTLGFILGYLSRRQAWKQLEAEHEALCNAVAGCREAESASGPNRERFSTTL